MPTIIETKAFQFDELSDDAKERARNWYREADMECGFDLADCMYEDFEECATRLGITFDQRETGRTRDGTKLYGPAIYWSGFCSQGDGACFEGSYAYSPTAIDDIMAHAPQDEVLHRIAAELTMHQIRQGFGITVTAKHSGNYYHAYSMSIDVTDERDEDREVVDANVFEELMRDFANWMYRQLEAENDYRTSDEAVDESIEANEYMFTEDGERHRYA